MFTIHTFDQQTYFNRKFSNHALSDPYAYLDAVALFEKVRRMVAWKKLVNLLVGKRSAVLMDLDQVKREVHMTGAHYRGLCEVPLSQIRGTQGRAMDFDAEFRPASLRVKERWLSIASAWYRGAGLPAVELVKIGDIYFVMDGNHRVSVAKAMGKHDIDAIVTEYHFAGPLPWENLAPQYTSQLAAV